MHAQVGPGLCDCSTRWGHSRPLSQRLPQWLPVSVLLQGCVLFLFGLYVTYRGVWHLVTVRTCWDGCWSPPSQARVCCNLDADLRASGLLRSSPAPLWLPPPPSSGSSRFPCAHCTVLLAKWLHWWIIATQRLGRAIALLKTFQRLPVFPRVGPTGPAPALPLPTQLLPLSPHPCALAAAAPEPPTLPPSHPPGGASPTRSPNLLSQIAHGCPFR